MHADNSTATREPVLRSLLLTAAVTYNQHCRNRLSWAITHTKASKYVAGLQHLTKTPGAGVAAPDSLIIPDKTPSLLFQDNTLKPTSRRGLQILKPLCSQDRLSDLGTTVI
jgi:hypothetical protein